MFIKRDYYDFERNCWDKKKILCVLLSSLLYSAAITCLILANERSWYAGLNNGILQSMFALYPGLLSLLFFFFVSEGLSPTQTVGVIIATVGVIIIGFGGSEPYVGDVAITSWIPVALELCGIVCFLMRNLLMKLLFKKAMINVILFGKLDLSRLMRWTCRLLVAVYCVLHHWNRSDCQFR